MDGIADWNTVARHCPIHCSTNLSPKCHGQRSRSDSNNCQSYVTTSAWTSHAPPDRSHEHISIIQIPICKFWKRCTCSIRAIPTGRNFMWLPLECSLKASASRQRVTRTYKLKRRAEMPRSSKVPLLRACVRLCRDSTWARLIRHNPSQTDPLSLSLPCHKCFGSKCVMQKGNSWCGLSTFVSACLKRWYTREKVHSFKHWFFLLQRNLVISRLFTKKPPKFPKFPSQTFVDQRHRQPLYILQSLSHLRGWGVNQPWHNFFVSYVSYVYIFQIKHSKTSQKTSIVSSKFSQIPSWIQRTSKINEVCHHWAFFHGSAVSAKDAGDDGASPENCGSREFLRRKSNQYQLSNIWMSQRWHGIVKFKTKVEKKMIQIVNILYIYIQTQKTMCTFTNVTLVKTVDTSSDLHMCHRDQAYKFLLPAAKQWQVAK